MIKQVKSLAKICNAAEVVEEVGITDQVAILTQKKSSTCFSVAAHINSKVTVKEIVSIINRVEANKLINEDNNKEVRKIHLSFCLGSLLHLCLWCFCHLWPEWAQTTVHITIHVNTDFNFHRVIAFHTSWLRINLIKYIM